MNSNESLLNDLDEKVAKHLLISRNCAQTSFVSLQEQFGLEGGTILKALTPFPGVALRGETCGAVIGSLMALGLIFGREELDDQEGFSASLIPAREFCHRFEKELGSTMCSDILESEFGKRYDLTDPLQVAEWQAAGSLDKCTAVVKKATQIVAEIIISKENP
ncbi:MAG: C-GCAxxG-C-C family protein [Pseudomonadota bacterium]|nr:C-GCAxxG-C-C family protein [Pseudomonadota bacterium]